MADLAALRAGLATNLATIPNANISPYVIANPQPPFMWVRPNPDVLVDYHQAMRNGVEYWHLVVQAYAGALDDVTAQQNLDAYLSSTGPSSVKAAIESERTLGGACSDLIVTELRGYTEYTRPDGATLIGAEWLLDVTA